MSQATINPQLIAARQRMNWTQSDACEAIGVPDIRSWQRWEQEGVLPNPYYRRKLCAIFGMSIEELGFARSSQKDASIIIVETEQKLSLPPSVNRYSEEEDRDWTTWFGVKQAQLFTMISAWSRQAFLHDEIQTMVDQEIKMMDETLNQYEVQEKQSVSRRQVLIAIAALPTTLLAYNHGLVSETIVEEFLPQCSASITACWHLLKGNGLSTGYHKCAPSFCSSFSTV